MDLTVKSVRSASNNGKMHEPIRTCRQHNTHATIKVYADHIKLYNVHPLSYRYGHIVLFNSIKSKSKASILGFLIQFATPTLTP